MLRKLIENSNYETRMVDTAHHTMTMTSLIKPNDTQRSGHEERVAKYIAVYIHDCSFGYLVCGVRRAVCVLRAMQWPMDFCAPRTELQMQYVQL